MKRSLKFLPLVLAVTMLLGWPSHGQSAPSHDNLVTWTAVPGAASYNLYRVTVSGTELSSTANQIATRINVTTFTDTTGVGGTKYFYEVTAVDASGVEGAVSNEGNATFLAPLPAPTLTVVAQ